MSLQAGAVALADVLSRGVMVHWFEGVAMLQEVCAAVESQKSGVAPPDLTSIWISADGSVSARPGPSREEPVLQLGRVLSDVIAQDAQVPPPLRLCISQATAQPAVFASVRDLSERLGYFERPDRPAIIRAVHARYLLAPATQTARVRPVAADSRTAAEAKKQPQQPRRPSRSKGRYVFVAAATVAVCVAIVAALVGRQSISLAQDAVVEAVVEAASPAPDARGGDAPLRPSGTSPQGAVLTSGSAANRNRTIRKDDRAVLESRRPADVEVGGLLEPPPAVDSAGSGEPVRPVVAAYERVEVFANHIYSIADTEVEAPKMVYPRLPAVPPDSADSARVNALEVVIGEDGTVERVRMVSKPRRLTDMMLLSAARNWQFTPAKLNGIPVRYRSTIRWAVLQP